jgi:hypothetical protein
MQSVIALCELREDARGVAIVAPELGCEVDAIVPEWTQACSALEQWSKA